MSWPTSDELRRPRRGSEDVVVQIAGACIDAPSDVVNEQVSRIDEPLEPTAAPG